MENLTKSVNVGWSIRRALGLAMMVGTVACGSVEEGSPRSDESPSTQVQEVRGENGVTLNGVTLNGVTLNGVTLNGVTLNGLNVSGLSTADFASWFGLNAAQNDMLMKYLVRCAVAEGQSRSYTDQSSGTSYLWHGSLGLAPNWASGQPINEAEQQVISACLAAHVNKFGVHVPLSVLGRTAQGQPIAYSAEELQAFPRREGCFFGNLFTGEGIFAGADRSTLFDGESSLRACALSTAQNASENVCAPMVRTESCENFCTLDPSGLFYTECNYNGRTYKPLTTRISQDSIFTCGDGVCQYTESCGMSTACEADCGSCG
ncbi:MAG TPA: hypothetical protein VNA24_11700 [Hyalangium sp.]|nr:hypothetical protein [Hyalangium sp.]